MIDEMQDYSYLQYVILGQMFSCSMTILGDRAQTVDGGAKDVQRFLPEIYGRTVRCIELNKSYRNTIEIASYAQKLTGLTGIEYLKRHGKPVTESGFSSMEEAMEEVLRCSALGEEGYETAAVLTMTEADAKACFAYLKERENSVFYIDRDSTAFQKGITVTTFYQAKGLEFDQVFVVGGDRKNDFFIAFRYISATRALHELYVFEVS